MMRLVGDVGGTNARFALVEEGAESTPVRERTLHCADHADLGAAIARYLADEGRPQVREAAVAVATAITSDHVKLTNSPWSFSIEATRQALALDRLTLVNDFTALALSLPLLSPTEVRQVGGGTALAGAPIGLLGAGTGLGVSGLVRAAEGWVPLEGEGGHTAFSPTTPRQCEVLRHLLGHFDHVSTERVASGPGLVTLYEALCRVDGRTPESLSPEQLAARADGDAHCGETLAMFCEILGAAAANLCVTLGARGGIYIGGGIVPALGERFDRSGFRARFESKGRFRDYVAAVPTFVITAHNPALRGVARVFVGAAPL